MVGNQVTSVMEVADPRRPDLHPALVRAHRGVRDELEAEGVHVEVPGPVLVGDGQREQLYLRDRHAADNR